MTDGWPLLGRDYPYDYKLGRIRKDRVRVRDGSERSMTFVENAGAVYIVPVTPDGDVLLIRQYRQSVGEWVWEVPAGALFDHEGDWSELAEKELSEETGATAESFEFVGSFYDSVPLTTSRCHIYLARNTVITQPAAPGHTEMIATHIFRRTEAFRMAREGVIDDGRSALALLRCESLLTG